jgi:putative endonuclease
MTVARQELGRSAEALAATMLEGRGMRILARNVRPRGRRGEIDLIAIDGRELVIVEVKARRDGSRLGPERPVLAVGPRKQRQLRGLAGAWLAERPAGVPYCPGGVRFDVVGLRVDAGGRVTEWEYLPDAF